ncbi:MAG: phasin family protein [Burkholderiales bacterium]|jgi:phasin family protein|nr:phasin family protein [Burkholderiales bacterium]MBP7520124.1 phasin family protein [Leptothrix sp. (in: b-proteobacteria)]
MNTPEQFAAAGKANLEALVLVGQTAFQGVEKLVELNLETTRAAMADAVEHAKALMAAKDAQAVFALQSAFLQPAAEKATAYSRQVYEITSTTQADVAKLVESQFGAAQQKVVALVDTAIKNAPAGTENAAALIKSAMTAANNALESAQQAAKQAVTMAEANFEAVSQSATNAAKAAAPKAKRAAA